MKWCFGLDFWLILIFYVITWRQVYKSLDQIYLTVQSVFEMNGFGSLNSIFVLIQCQWRFLWGREMEWDLFRCRSKHPVISVVCCKVYFSKNFCCSRFQTLDTFISSLSDEVYATFGSAATAIVWHQKLLCCISLPLVSTLDFIVLCFLCEQDGLDQLHSLVSSSGDSGEGSTSGRRSKNSKADLLRKCEYHKMGGRRG